MPEQFLDNVVAEPLDPGKEGTQPFLKRGFLRRISGGAIHLTDKRVWRERERV